MRKYELKDSMVLTDAEKAQKREQHNNYRNFIISMMVFMVVGGLMGIYLYFETGNVMNTIFGAFFTLLCIFFVTSKSIRSKMIYSIRGE